MLTQPPPPPPPPGGLGRRRRFLRRPVDGDQAISVMRLTGRADPSGTSYPADILDVSLGGLCLLLGAAEAFHLGDRLLMDLSNHPGFGVARMRGSIRWLQASGLAGVAVVGVAFDIPLTTLPKLS
ncbi:MAG: PilZ domain-containing protein [Prochlorococcaceae cyanobacterium]